MIDRRRVPPRAASVADGIGVRREGDSVPAAPPPLGAKRLPHGEIRGIGQDEAEASTGAGANKLIVWLAVAAVTLGAVGVAVLIVHIVNVRGGAARSSSAATQETWPAAGGSDPGPSPPPSPSNTPPVAHVGAGAESAPPAPVHRPTPAGSDLRAGSTPTYPPHVHSFALYERDRQFQLSKLDEMYQSNLEQSRETNRVYRALLESIAAKADENVDSVVNVEQAFADMGIDANKRPE